MGHGDRTKVYEFDSNGMIAKFNFFEGYVGDYTLYYENGKLKSSEAEAVGENGKFRYEYSQENGAVYVRKLRDDGTKNIALKIFFYDNGIMKEKQVVDEFSDPHFDTEIVRYDERGVEIEDNSGLGTLTAELKDSHGNWIKRTYDDGLRILRTIEYF